MGRITTISGKRVIIPGIDLSDGETSATFQLRITPADGFSLKASPSDVDVQIQARENGSGDPFTDIATSPIDLSGYTPETPVHFDVRAVASGSLVDIRRLALHIAVTKSAAANWSS
jgi:hypothetical protein